MLIDKKPRLDTCQELAWKKDNTPPNVTTNTPMPKRSRCKNTKPVNTHCDKTNLTLDTLFVVNLSDITRTNEKTQLLAR